VFEERGSPAPPPLGDSSADSGRAVDSIFIVGMFASGIDLLGQALSRLGLTVVGGVGDGGSSADLFSLNERLMAEAGGRDGVPRAAPSELVRVLAPWKRQAKVTMASTLTSRPAADEAIPIVWSDPRLSFLTPFWVNALDVTPAVVLIHRRPDDVALTDIPEARSVDRRMEWWDRYNRAALVVCSEYPSLVLSYEDLVSQPKAVVAEVLEFLETVGLRVEGDIGRAAELIETKEASQSAGKAEWPKVSQRQRTLDRLLTQLDGMSGTRMQRELSNLVELTSEFYDEDYYAESCGLPYTREERHWFDFFGRMAEWIVGQLQPATLLDVGCAIGMLVEALRERGVDAHGIDISNWAISQVPDALSQFCRVGSITEEIPGHYDLITCIEVLEHLPPSLAEASIANMCRHADMVLFSSTPDDFDEPTHLNVEPTSYWSTLFLRCGFLRDFEFDASQVVAPHAVLFRRRESDMENVVAEYERMFWNTTSGIRDRLSETVDEYGKLADVYQSLSGEVDALRAEIDRSKQEAERLNASLENEQRRRSAENLASYGRVRDLESSQRIMVATLSSRESELEALQNTKTFRYTARLRRVYGRLLRRGATESSPAAPPVSAEGTYKRWIEMFDTLDQPSRERISSNVSKMRTQPLITILMPVYDPPLDYLRAAVDSVRNQIYENWELCIADDCSTNQDVVRFLEECAQADPRIRVARRSVNGHISAASNTALELANGEWVATLDHDDVLAEHALALVALTLADHADLGLVYSDSDSLDASERRTGPYFKPDFDPLLLVGQNFVNHLCVVRRDLISAVSGYREGYEGSQDWDLVLRVSEFLRPEQVAHIPHVLYHWRSHAGSTASLLSTKPYAIEAGRRAVVDHLERTGRRAEVSRVGKYGHMRVSWELPDPAPLVSIIIPTRDGRLLQRCIDSLLDFTVYPKFEIMVVDNSSETFPTLRSLRQYEDQDDRITVVRDERPFNFAALNNRAARLVSGDAICLLNDDTEVISGEWLAEMVGQLVQPGIGAVGAKLYYDDGRIQHAGVALGVGGVAGHLYRMTDRLSSGYYGQLQLARRVSAVTAACMVVRREAWEKVNGFDEVNLPVAYNDVDLCLRLRDAGWEIAWTPHAELFHHESISRGPDTGRADAYAREVAYMQMRWGSTGLRNDPYYNPNLTMDLEDLSFAWPPRASYDRDL
jgi:glycosyltransferase involved in cell wall biosynthesis/2-polyprenyl-3-methyl-5-hydroxy-6-metoxy-1,4-benzoquinol methylase